MIGSLVTPSGSMFGLAEEENRPSPVVASKDRPNGKKEKEVPTEILPSREN